MNVRRAVAQLHSGHPGIMLPMGYFVESSLERNIAGESGFENSWVVVQEGTEDYGSTVDVMRR